MKYSILLLLFFFFLSSVFSQKKDKIEILNANELVFIEESGINAQRLIGDVQFRHQQVLMYCDSAYFFREENRMEAFGNVRINQGDTLNIYGNRLDYDGESRIAVIKGKVVKLISKDFTLTTDKIIFNRKQNTAYYNTSGKIISKSDNNQLESKTGYYHSSTKLFFFKNEVVLTNEDYVMRSDTMSYHIITEIARFFGPTTIEGDSNFIYCENGYYDTKKDVSEYYNNAYIISKSNKLEGDTLYYDRKIGYGRAKGNVLITDTLEGIFINGGKAFLFENPDSVTIVGEPLLTQMFDIDSLFMHADTFQIVTNTVGHRIMKAFFGVRIFKSDLQGICDSLTYSFEDSTIRLFSEPVLWSDANQLTAERIDIITSKGKIHSIFMNADAFVISEIDTSKYNQIKGLEMTGFFNKNELREIKVKGNGQTIYYGQDAENKFIGVNKAESSNLNIQIKNNAVKEITFLGQPDAVMHPMGELKSSELKYEGFKWLSSKRPVNKESVFEKD